MSKRSIEKLFQEKFEDFREHPDDRVWDRIEATLAIGKKSRNIIPFWWKLGAVAAGLALLLYLVGPFKNNDQKFPTITNTEKGDSPATKKQQENIDPVITDVDNNAINKKRGESTDIEDLNHGNENSRAVVSSDITEKKKDPNTKKRERKQSYKAPAAVHAPSGKETQWASKEKSDSENGSDIGIAINTDRFDPSDKLAQNSPENAVDTNKSQTENSEISSLIPQNIADTTEVVVVVVATDSVETSKKKSILEVLDEKDEPEVASGKKERWSVEPSIAPIYFNATGEGSSIAPSFVSNSKSGEVSLSYGVLVSYEIGKKLSVRSGIQKVNYGYNTNNISYTSAFGVVSIAHHIENIDYKMNSGSLSVQNQTQGKPIPGLAMDASAKNPTRTGKMLQQFGYLEVPMEVNYALLDKKFGIDLIGGVSSLFLTDNSVTLESGDRNTELGEANNINSVNFSANIGFGLNYKIMPKVRLNVEPIFKYQLNTFSNTAGSFRPFSIGVYSGLNFKF